MGQTPTEKIATRYTAGLLPHRPSRQPQRHRPMVLAALSLDVASRALLQTVLVSNVADTAS